MKAGEKALKALKKADGTKNNNKKKKKNKNNKNNKKNNKDNKNNKKKKKKKKKEDDNDNDDSDDVDDYNDDGNDDNDDDDDDELPPIGTNAQACQFLINATRGNVKELAKNHYPGLIHYCDKLMVNLFQLNFDAMIWLDNRGDAADHTNRKRDGRNKQFGLPLQQKKTYFKCYFL